MKYMTDIGLRIYIDAPILRAGLVIADLPGENPSGWLDSS
jgi:hypothetical protein